MRDDVHLLLREAPELIEIPKCVEEGAAPRVAAACGVGSFGVPERFAGLELITQLTVERKGLIGAREPLFRQGGVRRSLLAHSSTPS